MKKAAILGLALAMTMSLAACGNRDNGQSNGGQSGGNGTTENGGTNGSGTTNNNGTTNGNGTANNNGSTNGSGTTNGGTTTGDPITGGSGNSGTDSFQSGGSSAGSGGMTSNPNGTSGSGSTGTNGQTRSRVGNDLRRAADGVGDAVSDLVDDGRSALSRAASATTFERMLDNARVHDTDGVLTDGENSRW